MYADDAYVSLFPRELAGYLLRVDSVVWTVSLSDSRNGYLGFVVGEQSGQYNIDLRAEDVPLSVLAADLPNPNTISILCRPYYAGSLFRIDPETCVSLDTLEDVTLLEKVKRACGLQK